MLPLPELQQRFGSALRHAPGRALPIRANGLSPERRLQVYRHNMQSALLSALETVYPVTRRLVGEEFFAMAAQAYIAANPSHSGNVQEYGGAFHQFLVDYAPASSLPYLSDVAALEWQRLQTALAPPHTPMDLTALAKVPGELQPALHFHHQPAARVLSSRFPALTIWEFCQQEEPEGELRLERPGECVLFSRPRLDVRMQRIGPGEYRFLQALYRGDRFDHACRDAWEVEPEFDVEKQFAKLVGEEVFTSFYL